MADVPMMTGDEAQIHMEWQGEELAYRETVAAYPGPHSETCPDFGVAVEDASRACDGACLAPGCPNDERPF